jgi:hypothetical protein
MHQQSAPRLDDAEAVTRCRGAARSRPLARLGNRCGVAAPGVQPCGQVADQGGGRGGLAGPDQQPGEHVAAGLDHRGEPRQVDEGVVGPPVDRPARGPRHVAQGVEQPRLLVVEHRGAGEPIAHHVVAERDLDDLGQLPGGRGHQLEVGGTGQGGVADGDPAAQQPVPVGVLVVTGPQAAPTWISQPLHEPASTCRTCTLPASRAGPTGRVPAGVEAVDSEGAGSATRPAVRITRSSRSGFIGQLPEQAASRAPTSRA